MPKKKATKDVKEPEIKKVEKKKLSGKQILLIIIAGLVGLFAVFWIVTTPAPGAPIDLEARNTYIYAVLVEGGLNESIVDFTPDKTTVIIDVAPEEDPDLVTLFVLGTVAGAANETQSVSVLLYNGEEKLRESSVLMSDILAFGKNETTLEQFMATISTS